MSIDHAIALMTGLLEISVIVAGPLLGAALVGGLLIGVLQTATQIQEMSLSYVVKAACVLLVFVIAVAPELDGVVNALATLFEVNGIHEKLGRAPKGGVERRPASAGGGAGPPHFASCLLAWLLGRDAN